jgi:hypothetical protein
MQDLREDLSGEGVDPDASPSERAIVEDRNATQSIFARFIALAILIGGVFLFYRLFK